jgi:hypothetical protein
MDAGGMCIYLFAYLEVCGEDSSLVHLLSTTHILQVPFVPLLYSIIMQSHRLS